MFTVKYTIRFRDPSGMPEQRIAAAGYKLMHDGRILAFFDENGQDVFACPIEVAVWWIAEPNAITHQQVGVHVGATPYPSDNRPSIEQQAAAAAAAAGRQDARSEQKLVSAV